MGGDGGGDGGADWEGGGLRVCRGRRKTGRMWGRKEGEEWDGMGWDDWLWRGLRCGV